MNKKREKWRAVDVKLPDDIISKVNKEADHLDLSRSVFIRKIIEDFLKKYGSTSNSSR